MPRVPSRRLAPRRVVRTGARLMSGGAAAEAVTVENLSEGGAGLITRQAYPAESNAHLTLLLPSPQGQKLLQAECRIVQSLPQDAGGFLTGVQFTRFLQPTERALAALRDWKAPSSDPLPSGVERRATSYQDLAQQAMRAMLDILSSTDPRARQAANRALQCLAQLDQALPRRRQTDRKS